MKNSISCNMTECFAMGKEGKTKGKCTLLTNTDFGAKECPFYKTKKDYDEGIKKYGGLRPVH